MWVFQKMRGSFLSGVMVVWALLSTTGCSLGPTSYTALYEVQVSAVQGVTPAPEAAEALAHDFIDTFGRMGSKDFLPALDGLFADGDIYVNDTLSVYRDYTPLRAHLAGINQSVHAARVSLVNYWIEGDSVFVHWRMSYTLAVLGVRSDLTSHGISQLKMNQAGRIIFQQDYWDGNNGLYRQLPVVGWFYRLILPVQGL